MKAPIILWVKTETDRKALRMEGILFLVYWLCILLFLYAAVDKLNNFQVFKIQLGKSPLLTRLSDLVAWSVPSAELVICWLIFNDKTRLVGLYGFFFMMILFTCYLFVLINYSYFIPCNCASILQGLSHQAHMIFNLLYACIAVYGMMLIERIHKTKNVFKPGDESGESRTPV